MLFLLTFFSSLFILGCFGTFLNKSNVLIVIMSLELILFTINSVFVVSSVFFDDISGKLISLFVLVVAATESSLGLAILIVNFRLKGTVLSSFFSLLKA
uniref:NADH dehydrogenase subunit 4L n=1 Tax=Chrysotila carterae TaxID=13221 RepID=UPI0023AAACFB|nr:NADH dehydrogenase subunit 4L [Chrysotila carterae]WCH62788.1 NADH dehydrogenase subunit 4L [Chrysotila carterae]